MADLEHPATVESETTRGSYAVIRALVARLGGTTDEPIVLSPEEWQAAPPELRLRLERDPESQQVRLWIEARE